MKAPYYLALSSVLLIGCGKGTEGQIATNPSVPTSIETAPASLRELAELREQNKQLKDLLAESKTVVDTNMPYINAIFQKLTVSHRDPVEARNLGLVEETFTELSKKIETTLRK